MVVVEGLTVEVLVLEEVPAKVVVLLVELVVGRLVVVEDSVAQRPSLSSAVSRQPRPLVAR